MSRPPSNGGGRSNKGSQEHGAIKPTSNAFSNMSLPSFPARGPRDPKHANRVPGAQANVPHRPPSSTKSVMPSNFVEGVQICQGSYPATYWYDGKLEGKEHKGGTKEPDQELIIRVIMEEEAGSWLSFFQDEDTILRQIKHRYILHCYGWWEALTSDDRKMSMMPFPRCMNSCMEELIERNQGCAIPEPQVRLYMGQISQAIL